MAPRIRMPRSREYATVAADHAAGSVEWHSKYVHPNNIHPRRVGDFCDAVKMEARLRARFCQRGLGAGGERSEIKAEPARPGYYEVDKTT